MRPALELLAAAWSQPLTREATLVYGEFLADIPLDETIAAIRRLITTSEWRPSVAEIRRTVVEGRDPIPTAAEAAEQCELLDDFEARRRVPIGAQVPPVRPQVHPAVLAAWETVGYDAMPASFARAYRDARAGFVSAAIEGKLGAGWATSRELTSGT